MKWITITSPSFFDGEACFLHRLFDAGIDTLHLRKPTSSLEDCRRLLDKLSQDELSKTIIHDFFELTFDYPLKGIHLNSRNNIITVDYHGYVSRSCHSLKEVVQYKPYCGYMFLSPIFDSISKQGYLSTFSETTLDDAASQGIIDDKVIALGGVDIEKLPLLRRWHFGGAVMLGCILNIASLPVAQQQHKLREIYNAFHNNF